MSPIRMPRTPSKPPGSRSSPTKTSRRLAYVECRFKIARSGAVSRDGAAPTLDPEVNS